MNPTVLRGPHRQQGLGIIEVLVALVIVSFGVLGMAGLQLTGMKHSTGGFNRSKALMHAENMATRIRLNAPAVLSGVYAGFDSDADASRCNTVPAPYCQARKGAAAESCSPDELASFDTWAVACGESANGTIEGGVIDSLPEGRVSVDCGACAAGDTYTVTVEWNEGSTTSSDTEKVDVRRVQMRLRP